MVKFLLLINFTNLIEKIHKLYNSLYFACQIVLVKKSIFLSLMGKDIIDNQ